MTPLAPRPRLAGAFVLLLLGGGGLFFYAWLLG